MKFLIKYVLFLSLILFQIECNRNTSNFNAYSDQFHPARIENPYKFERNMYKVSNSIPSLDSPQTLYGNGNFPSIPSLSNCPCAGSVRCPVCGSFENSVNSCPCAPPIACPPCILAKTVKQIHERAQIDAQNDAKIQNSLSSEAELSQKLFEQAHKYAIETSELEEKARMLSQELQQITSKAQIARNKMLRAENQGKQIALQAIHTIRAHPPHSSTQTPEIQVKSLGTRKTTVTENVPQYKLNIGNTDGSGFIDMEDQSIQKSILDGESNAPDSIEEAEINNEVGTSKELANEAE